MNEKQMPEEILDAMMPQNDLTDPEELFPVEESDIEMPVEVEDAEIALLSDEAESEETEKQ